jgi:hypothetical protein
MPELAEVEYSRYQFHQYGLNSEIIQVNTKRNEQFKTANSKPNRNNAGMSSQRGTLAGALNNMATSISGRSSPSTPEMAPASMISSMMAMEMLNQLRDMQATRTRPPLPPTPAPLPPTPEPPPPPTPQSEDLMTVLAALAKSAVRTNSLLEHLVAKRKREHEEKEDDI